jgi:hypothetical protein
VKIGRWQWQTGTAFAHGFQKQFIRLPTKAWSRLYITRADTPCSI